MTETTKAEHKDNVNPAGISAGVIFIGSIVDINADGRPLVDFSENTASGPLIALTTLSLTRQHVSRQVALLFNNGDLMQPVIMGLIHNPLDELLQNFELSPVVEDAKSPFPEAKSGQRNQAELKHQADGQVYVDGKHVCIEGTEEVTLKCGKASITLTSSGKILIRGTYLLNRSTGVNRIMGGSVQVN